MSRSLLPSLAMFRISRSKKSDLYAIVPAHLSLREEERQGGRVGRRTPRRRIARPLWRRICRISHGEMRAGFSRTDLFNAPARRRYTPAYLHPQRLMHARTERPVFVCKTVFASMARIGELIRSIIRALVSSRRRGKMTRGTRPSF